jgi:hypothetical protein
MLTIYEAANSIEAHILLGLLKTVGIHGRVDGEYLQGGIGELPVMGLVRIRVAAADAERARQVIREWERQPR